MASHLADLGVDRLPVPNHPHLWVEFKREISFSDELAADQRRREIASQMKSTTPTPHQVAEFLIAKAAVVIAGWNIPDERGEIMPLGEESIARLKPNIIRFIGDEAERRLSGRPEEKEIPFEKPSPPTSPLDKDSTTPSSVASSVSE